MSPRHSVLLVDDDDDLRSLLTVAFLVTGNWEVTSAGTAEEAADLLRDYGIDVIVTDGDLGDGTGDDVLAAAGGRPVVLLSGSVDGPADTLLPAAPYTGAVTKPFNPTTLPALIGQLVAHLGQERR